MNILANINSLSDDIKTMQMLLDENGISYKNDIGYPLDDVATIYNCVDELEIKNQRIKILEENIEDLHGDLSLKDDEIESLEIELYELQNEVDYLKSELNN
jgi:chromosome segregation ATPase